MGYSISWLAVKSKSSNVVLEELGLAPSGRMADFGNMPFTGRDLAGGWFLIVTKGCDDKFIKPKSLTSLSKNCEIIACSIEEHVMFSASEQWIDGKRIWRAEHVGENGPIHLNTEGVLPQDFQLIAEIQYELQRAGGGEKAEVDYYIDIPLNVAKKIVGFKHDAGQLERNSFQVLERSTKKPWWKL
jgi:hypothetical protein